MPLMSGYYSEQGAKNKYGAPLANNSSANA
jgi:hypothetical protein